MYYNREILHNECGCLFANGIEDPQCLKRYYIVSDYEKCEYVKIIICNEHLRLKVAEYRHNNKSSYLYPDDVGKILANIFSNYVNIYDGVGYNFTTRYTHYNKTLDISKYYVNLTLCDRPNVKINMPLLSAIEILRTGKRWFNNLDSRILEEVKFYLENHVKNKVARTKYEKIIRQSNAITKEWDSDLREIKINELFISILELKL